MYGWRPSCISGTYTFSEPLTLEAAFVLRDQITERMNSKNWPWLLSVDVIRTSAYLQMAYSGEDDLQEHLQKVEDMACSIVETCK